jgi:hypothetical protein
METPSRLIGNKPLAAVRADAAGRLRRGEEVLAPEAGPIRDEAPSELAFASDVERRDRVHGRH